MTYITKPKLHHPDLPKNRLFHTRRDYEGPVSTLCAGCGHDSISAAIVQSCYELDLPGRDEIVTDYAPGAVNAVTRHDGSVIRLRKLDARYDPTDKLAAMAHIADRRAAGEVITGLLHVDDGATDLHHRLKTVETPLNRLADAELCPEPGPLEASNARLR